MDNKKPALKKYLITEIMKQGYLTLEQVHAIAESLGHKESTAERRLRESESPLIEAVRNEKGYIQGYRYKMFNIEQQAKKADEYAPRLQKLFV